MIENTLLQNPASVSQLQNLLNVLEEQKEPQSLEPKRASNSSWRKFRAESSLSAPKTQEPMEDSMHVNEGGQYFINCYFNALAYLNEGKEESALELISEMYNDPRIANMEEVLFPLEFRAMMLLYKGQKEEAVNLLSNEISEDSTRHRKIMLYALGIEKTFHYVPCEDCITVDEKNLELANQYFWKGDYDLAISLCNEVEKKSQFYADSAVGLRADCHLLKGNINEARQDYATVLGYESLGAFNDPYPYSLALLLSGETAEVRNLWIDYANFRFDGFFLGFLLGAFEKHPSMFRTS